MLKMLNEDAVLSYINDRYRIPIPYSNLYLVSEVKDRKLICINELDIVNESEVKYTNKKSIVLSPAVTAPLPILMTDGYFRDSYTIKPQITVQYVFKLISDRVKSNMVAKISVNNTDDISAIIIDVTKGISKMYNHEFIKYKKSYLVYDPTRFTVEAAKNCMLNALNLKESKLKKMKSSVENNKYALSV